MSTLFFSRSLLILASLMLIITFSCRKKIDYEQVGTSSSSIEPIDPSQPIYEPWELIGPSSGVYDIESDGNVVYFNRTLNGYNRMFSMDTSGTTTELFDIGASNNVTLISISNSKLYYSTFNSSFSDLLTLNEFDVNGIQNSYELNLNSVNYPRLNAVIDLGSEIFVGGSFHFESGSDPKGFACKIDKSTGDSIPMPGLKRQVRDARLYNNEIYVVGSKLDQVSGTAGLGIAKWSGSQWDFLGAASGFNGANITGLGIHNNQIIVGGGLSNLKKGIYQYDETSDNFLYTDQFTIGNTSLNTAIIYVKEYNGKLYAGGTLDYTSSSIRSVYEFDNGNWRSIGGLGLNANNFAACQGYIFAVSGGKIYRYKL